MNGVNYIETGDLTQQWMRRIPYCHIDRGENGIRVLGERLRGGRRSLRQIAAVLSAAVLSSVVALMLLSWMNHGVCRRMVCAVDRPSTFPRM